MRRLLTRLRRRLPRRRRRHWRFVSGRRRRIGVLVFALLALLAYSYWHFTNEARIRRQVISYLEQMTGGMVKVERAEFRLFSGIRVKGMRVFLAGNTEIPFFSGDVVINHSPGSLLGGQLEATEIICMRRVRLIQDYRSGLWNTQGMFPFAGGIAGPVGAKARLPIIRWRGMLEIITHLDGQYIRRPEAPLNVALVPDETGEAYKVTFLDPDSNETRGVGALDLTTGRLEIVEGQIGGAWLDKVLPKRWLDWKTRHKLTFTKPFAISLAAGIPQATSRPTETEPDHLAVTLTDVSMVLPEDEGGLSLSGVSGGLILDADGVKIEKLTGRVGGPDGPVFTLNGRYSGYEASSNFKIFLDVAALKLPLPPGSGRAWESMAKLLSWSEPTGLVDLSLQLNRADSVDGGRLQVSGSAVLRNVSTKMPHWGMRIEGLTGKVLLDGQSARLVGMKGRLAGSETTISGEITGVQGGMIGTCDVTVKQLEFDQFAAKIVSYNELASENKILKRDLQNVDVNLRKLQLDTEMQRQKQGT